MAKFGWKENGTTMFRLPAKSTTVAGFLMVAAATAWLFAQEIPVIRVNVNLVHVVATVRTRTGQLIGNLGKDDFEIYDNGVKQELVHFARQTDQPISVALMIDVSGSTAKDLALETDSASKFLKALLAEGNPEDRVALYSFDDSVRVAHTFTKNFTTLNQELHRIHGSAGTALYDAIYLVSHELESRSGRKVMVIISNGANTTSSYTSENAREAAQLADAVLYPIVVMPITSDAGRNRGGENFLKWIAEGTGGR